METRRLVRTDSPGRPPRLSHSSWTMGRGGVCVYIYNMFICAPMQTCTCVCVCVSVRVCVYVCVCLCVCVCARGVGVEGWCVARACMCDMYTCAWSSSAFLSLQRPTNWATSLPTLWQHRKPLPLTGTTKQFNTGSFPKACRWQCLPWWRSGHQRRLRCAHSQALSSGDGPEAASQHWWSWSHTSPPAHWPVAPSWTQAHLKHQSGTVSEDISLAQEYPNAPSVCLAQEYPHGQRLSCPGVPHGQCLSCPGVPRSIPMGSVCLAQEYPMGSVRLAQGCPGVPPWAVSVLPRSTPIGSVCLAQEYPGVPPWAVCLGPLKQLLLKGGPKWCRTTDLLLRYGINNNNNT